MWWFPTPPLYSTSKIGGYDLHFVSHFQLSGLVIALLVSRAVVHLLQWIVGPQSCISHIMVSFPHLISWCVSPPHTMLRFPNPTSWCVPPTPWCVPPPHIKVCFPLWCFPHPTSWCVSFTHHHGLFPIVVCLPHPTSWCVFPPTHIMVCFPPNSHHGVFPILCHGELTWWWWWNLYNITTQVTNSKNWWGVIKKKYHVRQSIWTPFVDIHFSNGHRTMSLC